MKLIEFMYKCKNSVGGPFFEVLNRFYFRLVLDLNWHKKKTKWTV